MRIAGVDIGNQNGSWGRLFKNSIEVFKKIGRQFLLITDGDSSILDSLKGKVKVVVQRCLWHIPYQVKYALWQDRVKRKSANWLYVISELMEISAIRPFVDCMLNGKTTSKAKCVMRTVNMRTKVSKWSDEGVLNVIKIRLAYYYNGFDA